MKCDPVAFTEYVWHAADMGIKSHRNENKIQKFTQDNLVSVKKNQKRKSEMKLISKLLFQYGFYNLSYQDIRIIAKRSIMRYYKA